MSKRVIIMLAFLLAVSIVAAIPEQINLQGKLTNAAGSPLQGTYNFTFNFYNVSTEGVSEFNYTTAVTTDSRGIYDIIIKGINFTFDKAYYLGVKVADDAEMSPRINISSVPYSLRSNISDDLTPENTYKVKTINVTSSIYIGDGSGDDILEIKTQYLNYSGGNIEMTGNISLGSKISFKFGQLIDNFVNGWLRVTGGLNVTGETRIEGDLSVNDVFNVSSSNGNVETSGNVSAAYFKGDGSLLTGITGSIGLWVNGTYWTSLNISYTQNVNISDVIYVNASSGKVGISVKNATAYLDVAAATSSIASINIHTGAQPTSPKTGDIYSNGTNLFFYDSSDWQDITSQTSAGGWTDDGSIVRLTTIGDMVSVGSTSANTKVYVDGNGTFTSDLFVGGNLIASGTSSPTSSSSNLGWADDGTVIRLNTITDSVGIGTLNPTSKLDVAGTINATAIKTISLNVTGISYFGTQAVSNIDASGNIVGLGNLTINNSVFFVDGASEMVGIGVSSPSSKLDVAGTANATQFTINGTDLYSIFAELSDKIGNSSSEIWGVVDNESFARLTGFSGENITSGTVADAYVTDDLTIVSTKTINTTGGLNVSGGAYIGGMAVIGSLNVTGTAYLNSMTFENGNITATWGKFTNLNVSSVAYLGATTLELGNITPNLNNTYSLGSPTKWWRDLYLGNDSLYIGGTALSSTGDGVLMWNGSSVSSVAVQTGDNIVLGDSASEKVGIGTTTPAHKLEVAGAMNVTDVNVSNDLRVAGDLTVIGTSNLGSITISADNITVNGVISKDGNISFFNSSGSEKMRITSDGRVGIGVTVPKTKLDILGNVSIKGDLGIALPGTVNVSSGNTVINTSADLTANISVNDAIKISNGTAAYDEIFTVSAILAKNITLDSAPTYNMTDASVYKDSNLFLIEDGDGTDKVVVDKSGNVGVGIASPTSKLDVAGTINATAIKTITLNVTDTTYFGTQAVTNIDASGNIVGLGNLTINNSVFFVNRDDEKVGIGTMNPSEKLNVSGNVGVSGNVTAVYFKGNGSLLTDIDDTNASQNYGYNGSAWIGLRTTPEGILKIKVNDSDYMLNNGDTATGDYTFDSGTLFIDSSNNRIGIGTTTPTTALDVAGTINATMVNATAIYQGANQVLDASSTVGNTTAEIWVVVDNETFARLTGFSGENITSGSVADARVVDDLTIASSKAINTTGGLNVSGSAYIGGNIGIGTTTPTHKLEVAGAMNVTDLNVSNDLRVAGDLTVIGTSNLGSITISADNITVNNIVSRDGNISFYNASGSEKMRIVGESGNVGIGTNAPSHKLQVAGAVNLTSSSTSFRIDSNGNVVINLRG